MSKVSTLWHLFRLGSPLLTILKLYNPDYQFNQTFEDITPNGQYTNSTKKAIYNFLVFCKDELGIQSEEDTFTITDLYKDDIEGFIKVH